MTSRALARVVSELERRDLREVFSSESLLFDKQLAFVRDPARFKVAVCSRRAGKTVGVAVSLLEDVGKPPYADQFYITKTLKNAKKIIWRDLKALNRKYELGGIPNETEAYLRFPQYPNEPCIYLGGAKDESESENIRGQKGKKAIVDEPQSMRGSILEKLMKDAIRPALWDYNGALWVTGTPGPVRLGYLFDIDKGAQKDKWSHHHWTILDNPWIKKLSGREPEDILQEELEQRGVTEEDPTFQREGRGLWVDDIDALVVKYNAERNHYDEADLPAGKWTHIMGVDLGFQDADAIAVLGWSDLAPKTFIRYQEKTRKQGITELGNAVKLAYDKWKPVEVWVDPGGLGAKIIEELRRRWGVPCKAAEKVRKFEHIELMNDALRTGVLLAPRDSPFAEEAMLTQWDMDARARGVLKISDAYHPDVIDAVQYAYRACRQYHFKPAPPPQTEKSRMDDLHARLAKQYDPNSRVPWHKRDARRMGR